MKFVTFHHESQNKIGVLLDNQVVVDLLEAELEMTGEKTFSDQLLSCMNDGEHFIERVHDILKWIEEHKEYNLKLGNVKLLAPIPRPAKNIFCIGKNYADHAKELGSEKDIPTDLIVFSKPPTTVTGPDHPVLLNENVTDSLDYEGELAVVIGKKGKAIPKEEALDHVFGYTIINDVTARDLQSRHKQFLLGKSLDTSCPMGPSIVHKSEIKNPDDLKIETKVNGEIRQSSNTNELIFDISTIIATISEGTTLEPGDVIATGTPAGVGKGFKPPRFLKSGDVVEITIEGLGTLTNNVQSETK